MFRGDEMSGICCVSLHSNSALCECARVCVATRGKLMVRREQGMLSMITFLTETQNGAPPDHQEVLQQLLCDSLTTITHVMSLSVITDHSAHTQSSTDITIIVSLNDLICSGVIS